MKKMTLAAAGAGRRTAILAAASTIALTALANAQSTEEQRKRDEAAARIAASYGVMLDTISVYADRNARQALDLPQNIVALSGGTSTRRPQIKCAGSGRLEAFNAPFAIRLRISCKPRDARLHAAREGQSNRYRGGRLVILGWLVIAAPMAAGYLASGNDPGTLFYSREQRASRVLIHD